jgi:hypothetical protein
MKKYLILALIIAGLINYYATSIVDVRYGDLSYKIPASYFYLIAVLIFIIGGLLAYQWQLLKIYLLQWRLKKTQNELHSTNDRLSDYVFLLQFLDQEDQLSLYCDVIKTYPRLTAISSRIGSEVDALSEALVDKNNNTIHRLLHSLQKKLPTSLHQLLLNKVYLSQLPEQIGGDFINEFKKWPSWMWKTQSTYDFIFSQFFIMNQKDQEYFLKKISPLDLKADHFKALEDISKEYPAEWLVFFYAQHWQEMAGQSIDLAILLIKINTHLGFIAQAKDLAEQLPASLIKVALLQTLTESAPQEQPFLTFQS